MDSLDSLFTITCGACGATAPVLDWTAAPITGDLPRGTYQCPSCHHAFKRQAAESPKPWEKDIQLKPVSPVL